MKIFIDTANVEQIREANALGIVDGVTTNPSLIAQEGRDFRQVVEEICSIVDGPISAEVVSLEAEGMVAEAEDLSRIHKNIVVKIPMTAEGLKAVKACSGKGIATNVTLVFSSAQALLAAFRAGDGAPSAEATNMAKAFRSEAEIVARLRREQQEKAEAAERQAKADQAKAVKEQAAKARPLPQRRARRAPKKP